MGTNRMGRIYRDGVEAFIDYAVNNLKKMTNIERQGNYPHLLIPCPCTKCLNHVVRKTEEVHFHLFSNGIDQNYTQWTYHGEKDEPIVTTEYGDNHMDFDAELPTHASETVEMVNATKDNFDDEDPDDHAKLLELLSDAEKPLYSGCPDFTKLSAIVHLLNLKSKYGCSDQFFTELLGLLKKMLPDGNELPENTYQAKKIFKLLGSGYKKIDVCINNCLLYWKEDKELTVCRTCGTSRWKVDKKTKKVYEKIPANVMWYFPIIPRLQRLFKITSISEELRWHATRRKTDGVLRHPADSQAWRTIDNEFPEIANDPRNLRLGISADGVDVNRGNRHHSVWPVLSVIYNLPPWLCMKRKFIMLSVLISGYPGNDIDVFLEPLVDDLQLLFETGVDTYDASTKQIFNLRAVVLWTINDYPALGTLCGCPTSGYKGCVVCGKDTYCIRLPASSKQSYVGHRRYLPYNHAFRKQKKAFNGKQEFGTAPIPMTGEQIYNEVKHIENKWGRVKQANQEDARGRGGKIQMEKRKRSGKEDGTSGKSNEKNGAYWKKFNIWYRKLKYWRHNEVQHCIDFMHIEKNVGESLVGTLLNVPGKTKDGENARLDLKELGIDKPELFVRKDDREITVIPPAGYTLTNAEKDIFCQTLYNMRVPQGYCSNFSSLVSLTDRKLIGLKSHDYHMLMQEFLPIAIRSIMDEPTRKAIIRFCFFFKSICSKEIILEELDKMQEELCVTLCLLEKFFPPSFFDIMVHLTVHLIREVKLCGPVCFRWMYPFERCMKVIKGHVRNRNRPEGCIAEETIAEETIEFFGEYQKSMKTIGIPNDTHETDENEDGKPLSAAKSSEVSAELFQKAHLYVILNTDEIVPYIE